MAQRHSEYKRMEGDTYITPQWVWDALLKVDDAFGMATDCCPAGADFDFRQLNGPFSILATNPPFNIAESILRHALKTTEPTGGKVAMLLPMTWDAAKSRRDLFDNPRFKAKYTLTKRIRWENLEQKKNGPSTNHAWYIWDKPHNDKPVMGWLP